MLHTRCGTSNCRHLADGACKVNGCMEVRLYLIAEGKDRPEGPCTVALPEPASPEGVTGFDVAGQDFPPTIPGYIAARGRQGQTGAEFEIRRR